MRRIDPTKEWEKKLIFDDKFSKMCGFDILRDLGAVNVNKLGSLMRHRYMYVKRSEYCCMDDDDDDDNDDDDNNDDVNDGNPKLS